MFGEIFGSIVFGINEVVGDPLGAVADAIDESSRIDQLRKQSEPSYRIASEKIRLYNKIKDYEVKLLEQQNSKYPSEGLMELYSKWIDEYKEKLNLLK